MWKIYWREIYSFIKAFIVLIDRREGQRHIDAVEEHPVNKTISLYVLEILLIFDLDLNSQKVFVPKQYW